MKKRISLIAFLLVLALLLSFTACRGKDTGESQNPTAQPADAASATEDAQSGVDGTDAADVGTTELPGDTDDDGTEDGEDEEFTELDSEDDVIIEIGDDDASGSF